MWVEVALPLPVDSLFTYKIPEKLISEIQVGHHVLVPFRNRSLTGIAVKIIDSHSIVSVSPKELLSLTDMYQKISPYHLELTKWISENYACSWGESLLLVSPFLRKSMKIFYKDYDKRVISSHETKMSYDADLKALPFSLTQEQVSAIKCIEDSVEKSEHKTFLLFGVTSSGKTEVYLHAIQRVLEKRKQALFLVPEISLCHPFFEILTDRFGARVGMWHSQISLKEKRSLLDNIQKGSIDIIVGARSALFAPLSRLGIIVVDEEHDTSYKQQEKPRYHARLTALKLSELHHAITILGSATPSIESFYLAQQNKVTLLELPQRVPSHSSLQTIVVNRRAGSSGFSPFTSELVTAISTALARREQVILALNRRGFSTFIFCRSCGYVWKCPSCKLTLVHHKDPDSEDKQDYLICHYCLRKIVLPKQCDQCSSQVLLMGGYGTQKIVQEIKKLFSSARILRLDRDVRKKKSEFSKTYKTFREESADILVGTQMVTQGFDFPRVTLVGIIDADTALYHSDFRSAEKTFQWITQASGRAGRSPMGGKVIVQSSVPNHYALEFACTHDYISFYKKEIDFRSSLFYPPFSKLVLFRVQSSRKKDLVISESERLNDILKNVVQNSSNQVQLLGPGPSPKEHLRKQLRWQILVKCINQELFAEVVRAGKTFVPKSGVRVTIDVDPYDIQ